MVKKQLYSENFTNSLYNELMLLEQLLDELDDSKKKKQYQKLYNEKLKYLLYLSE